MARIKKGDLVQVISGKDRGVKGKVIEALWHGATHRDDRVQGDRRLQPGAALDAAAQHMEGLAERPGHQVLGVIKAGLLPADPAVRHAVAGAEVVQQRLAAHAQRGLQRVGRVVEAGVAHQAAVPGGRGLEPVGEVAAVARPALLRIPEDAGEALARELRANWPELTPGVHRLHLDDERVTLTLYFGDARDGLAQLDLRADALFLDGFSPARSAACERPGAGPRSRPRCGGCRRFPACPPAAVPRSVQLLQGGRPAFALDTGRCARAGWPLGGQGGLAVA